MERSCITLLASNDLMLTAAIDGAVRARGGVLKNVADAAGIAQSCASLLPSLLLIDLRLPALDILGTVAQLRDQSDKLPYLVACGPHVHEAALRAAREAGCDEVLTRGQIERALPGLLDRAFAAEA